MFYEYFFTRIPFKRVPWWSDWSKACTWTSSTTTGSGTTSGQLNFTTKVWHMFYEYFFTRNPFKTVPWWSDWSKACSWTSSTTTRSGTTSGQLNFTIKNGTYFVSIFSRGIHLKWFHGDQIDLRHMHGRHQQQQGVKGSMAIRLI